MGIHRKTLSLFGAVKQIKEKRLAEAEQPGFLRRTAGAINTGISTAKDVVAPIVPFGQQIRQLDKATQAGTGPSGKGSEFLKLMGNFDPTGLTRLAGAGEKMVGGQPQPQAGQGQPQPQAGQVPPQTMQAASQGNQQALALIKQYGPAAIQAFQQYQSQKGGAVPPQTAQIPQAAPVQQTPARPSVPSSPPSGQAMAAQAGIQQQQPALSSGGAKPAPQQQPAAAAPGIPPTMSQPAQSVGAGEDWGTQSSDPVTRKRASDAFRRFDDQTGKPMAGAGGGLTQSGPGRGYERLTDVVDRTKKPSAGEKTKKEFQPGHDPDVIESDPLPGSPQWKEEQEQEQPKKTSTPAQLSPQTSAQTVSQGLGQMTPPGAPQQPAKQKKARVSARRK